MKIHPLLEFLDTIDPKLIEEAEQTPPKASKKPVIHLIAAMLAFAILTASAIVLFPPQTPSPPTSDIQLGTSGSITPSTNSAASPSEPANTVNYSYLNLDINPSVQFTMDGQTVIGCIAINEDGANILTEVELNNLSLEEALPLVLEEMIAQGYLAKTDYAPILLLSARGADNAQEILHSAITATRNLLLEKEMSSFIIPQEIDHSEMVAQLAARYGISVGKMQYVLEVLGEEVELSPEEAASKSIIELFGMDIEKRLIAPPYSVGDYDEYGEKVLFVGTVEDYVGYIPWDLLADEYKKELSEMYTPEALAILSMPRVWTTVPNVVGLSADEALALMYSRSIAPDIHYMDNAAARAAGFTDGTCFQQNIPQGMRWNSDAAVGICILISENKDDIPA